MLRRRDAVDNKAENSDDPAYGKNGEKTILCKSTDRYDHRYIKKSDDRHRIKDFCFGVGFIPGVGMVTEMEFFFVIFLILFVYILAKNIGQFIENENAPILTVHATIVDMRRKTHHHHSNGHHHHSHTYHVTFEVESGERLELRVRRSEYNELAVGDRGTLTHQGTRYRGFER